MLMTERFPDIELYILKADPEKIANWLESAIGPLEVIQSTDNHVHWRCNDMDVFLNAKAEKNFSSLWFKQNKTPWNNDLDAGRAAYAVIKNEIRCSDSGWEETKNEVDQPSGGWIKINQNGEKPFSWD